MNSIDALPTSHTHDEDLRGVDFNREKVSVDLSDTAIFAAFFAESGENRDGVEAIVATE